jgi:hypothetical protein
MPKPTAAAMALIAAPTAVGFGLKNTDLKPETV